MTEAMLYNHHHRSKLAAFLQIFSSNLLLNIFFGFCLTVFVLGWLDLMDNDNWRPPQVGELPIDAGDWRSQLQPDSRQRIINKM